MILVTGATGHFGKAVIEFLLKKGTAPDNLAALVRDPAKAADLQALGLTLKTADYDDYDALVAAFTGTEKLLLVSANDPERRGQQQLNGVLAAKAAGVKHIVYTSYLRKNGPDATPLAALLRTHTDTEEAIIRSGMQYTILKNALYAEMLPFFLGENVQDAGIHFPSGAGPAAYTLRRDMAEAAAVVLATGGHENRSYNIADPISYSMEEIAALLSELSGKTVRFHNTDAETYHGMLTGNGVPPAMATILTGMATTIQLGEFEAVQSDLPALIGRSPASLKEFLASVYRN